MGEPAKVHEFKKSKEQEAEEKEGRRYKTSEELKEESTFHKRKLEKGGKFDSNRDRLDAMLELMEESISIMEGLFKARPSSGQVYALTNLITQAQGLMSQLDQAYNFKELADSVMADAVEPIMEQLLIQLSQKINDVSKNIELDPADKKEVKKALSSMLKQYALDVQNSRNELTERIETVLIEQ